MRRSITTIAAISAAFLAGLFSHLLYQRWNASSGDHPAVFSLGSGQSPTDVAVNQSHPVQFVPLSSSGVAAEQIEIPVIVARDVEKIRALAGRQARIRGRIFRVGHSAKSNTYFLNFGPSREALTAVIFATAVERFEKAQRGAKSFENKEVELTGEIKDHPQYGLEIVLEDPKQIKILQ